MTTLKPYPAYKDSGIPWLGETPAHWRGQRLKSVVTVAREIVLAADHPLPYVGMEHIRSWSGRRYGSIASTAVNGQAIKFQAGQILFGKLRPYLAKVYRSDMEGLASTEFLVLDSNEQYHSYVFWLLISKDFIDLVDSSTFGARMPRADWAFVGDQVVPLPPLDEQRAIADFLDGMDARITRFIAARRKIIALLEEKKQAVINGAVTRGLDPDVPLKDSGVDWLGEIPAHWEVRANRTLFRLKKRLVGEQADEYTLLSLTLRGLIKRDMVNPEGKFPSSFDTYQEVDTGDLVFCLFDIEETPRCVGLSPFAGMITGAYTVVEPTISSTARYLYRYYLALDQKKALKPAYTGLRNTIQRSRFMAIKSPLPPLDERLAIVDHIDRESSRIDAVIVRSRREIELFQEYRTRLISDVVTGKLDVRGVVLPAIEEVIGAGIEQAMEDEGTGPGGEVMAS